MAEKPIPLLALLSVMAFMNCRGAELQVTVSDARGRPVWDAVVIATIQTGSGPAVDRRSGPTSSAAPAVMDQIGKAFVPSVLVVRTGTPVIFPNSDTIAHQVYSFSPAKRFELGLYRGDPHPPVVFDQAGLVVLGCNIHDNMVGYIVVTDSPYFGKTDERGALHMSSLPSAEYEVSIWSPHIPRGAASIKQLVTVSDTQPARAELELAQALPADQEARRDARMLDY